MRSVAPTFVHGMRRAARTNPLLALLVELLGLGAAWSFAGPSSHGRYNRAAPPVAWRRAVYARGMTPAAPYRPLPPPPSSVWARAARGLSLLAVVALAQVPFNLVAGLLSYIALCGLRTADPPRWPTIAASLLQLGLHVATSLVTAYALVAVAALPAFTRARPVARAALALCAVAFAQPFVANLATALAQRSESSAYRASVIVGSANLAFGWAVAAACTSILAALLGRLCDALDAPRPRGLWALVACGLGLRLVAPAFTWLEGAASVINRPVGLASLLVSTALWALQAWGWARALRTVARVVSAARAGA
ncbi:MAG: hypothetical protein JWM10_1218 [Myxococcaceae bacterium]|nr:hypothetical protein [Myxococcaceae bacterium]